MTRTLRLRGGLLLAALVTQAAGQTPVARQQALLVGRWQAMDVFNADTTYVTLVFRADGTGSVQSSRNPARPPMPFTYAVAAPDRLQLVRSQKRTTHYLHALTRQVLQLGPPPEREKFPEILETLHYRRVFSPNE